MPAVRSIEATSSDNVMSRSPAISFSPFRTRPRDLRWSCDRRGRWHVLPQAISSLVSRFNPVLIKIATVLRVARASESTLCFAAAKTDTIFSGTLLVELALDFLACLTKIDDIAHAWPRHPQTRA